MAAQSASANIAGEPSILGSRRRRFAGRGVPTNGRRTSPRQRDGFGFAKEGRAWRSWSNNSEGRSRDRQREEECLGHSVRGGRGTPANTVPCLDTRDQWRRLWLRIVPQEGLQGPSPRLGPH